MTEGTFKIAPLTPLVGAEVTDIDLARPLNEASVAALRQALLAHHVLFFRDQDLSLDQLSALGRCFGAPHTHPTVPDLDGHPGIIEVHTDANSTVYSGRRWHSDVSCDAEPPVASILHLHRVPESGGDTLFANMVAAYEALSAPLRGLLSGLTAAHDANPNFRNYYRTEDSDLRDGVYPVTAHPVVRRHPETGANALYVNEIFTTHIIELASEESRALLDLLFAHIRQPRFHCRFRWRRNSVAFWDNRSSQHLALWDYYPETRSGHRFTIAGDKPVG